MKINKKGFTLIELLVVIAIIGILGTMVTIQLSTARAKARDAKRLADLTGLSSAIEVLESSNTGAAITCGTPNDLATCGNIGDAVSANYIDPSTSTGTLCPSVATPITTTWTSCTIGCKYRIEAEATALSSKDYKIIFCAEKALGTATTGPVLHTITTGHIVK